MKHFLPLNLSPAREHQQDPAFKVEWVARGGTNSNWLDWLIFKQSGVRFPSLGGGPNWNFLGIVLNKLIKKNCLSPVFTKKYVLSCHVYSVSTSFIAYYSAINGIQPTGIYLVNSNSLLTIPWCLGPWLPVQEASTAPRWHWPGRCTCTSSRAPSCPLQLREGLWQDGDEETLWQIETWNQIYKQDFGKSWNRKIDPKGGATKKMLQKLHTMCEVRGEGSVKFDVWTSKKVEISVEFFRVFQISTDTPPPLRKLW